MKYLANDRNIVRDAALTATNVVASNVVYRTDDDEKAGGGQVALTGDYTGASDATIDVKIVDTTISGSPKISAPTFTGIGNGTLTAIAADSSIAAQVFTLTLEDLGTVTAKAYAPFQGVTLRAKSTGTTGNAITVSVDNSGLTFTDTAFALQHDLSAGTNEYIGDEWNFGGAILNADLTIPDNAPRLTFGADPQVYRQYKFYRDGHYVFAFSPSPVRDVPKGTVIKAVTGTHSVTVADGVTSDTISGVVSLYDALAGIRDNSTLVDVVGAIINDKTSGGQAAVELSVWTSAYVTAVVPDGSDIILHSELTVSPLASAPTETLIIRCEDSTVAGGEKWSVRGDVSGRLADAITGALYEDGDYRFTIPLPTGAVHTNAGIEVSLLLNGDRESEPSLCPVMPLIGAAGRAGTWSFVYKKRPVTVCDCTAADFSGGPNYTCLGIDPPGGTSVSDESRLIRLQRLSAFVRELIGANTPPYPTVGATDTFDVDVINKGAGILQKCLESIASAPPLASWQASHVYAIDDMRQPVVSNGYRFAISAITSDFKSGSSEPSWVTTIGSTTTDHNVTWTCIGKTPYGMWDDMFAQFCAEMRVLAQGFGAYKSFLSTAWAATTAYSVGAIVRPGTRNGHLYSTPHGITTSGGSTPTFPTQTRAAVADGDGYWVEFLNYWNAGATIKTGTQITIGDGYVWEAEVGGTTGGSEPTFTGNSVTDNTVTWVRKAGASLGVTLVDQYYGRFTSLCNEIEAAAGIDPNFPKAGTEGDGCWQDFGGNYWWVFQGEEAYLPLFTGRYNHSAKRTFIAGVEHDQSTQEWGVGLKIGCPENLIEGDVIQIRITGDTSGNGYQAGDNYAVSITHAEPIPLGGGQTGDDTLTFHVSGSVVGTLPPYYVTGNSPAARANSHAYAVGDRYIPASPNGRFYECTAAGTSGGSVPTFTTNRTSFTDGSATFLDMGNVVGYTDSGLQFLITLGGISFGLGDTFVFDAEGGHFKWQINGGGFSSSIAIADSVLLTAGLSATFTGGAAPSWKLNDQWSFKCEAVNGVDGIRQPTDERMSWTGSTQIDIVPTSGAIDSVLLGDHTIPSDATITLLGSNDNFVHTPLSQVLPWKDRHIKAAITATYAKYRVTIDRGGSMNWLVLEKAVNAVLPNGVQELGAQFTKHIRMPNLVSRKALGATLTHTALTQASVDDFVAMLSHACQYDDGRIGIIPNDSEDECAIVQFAENTLDITDAKEFQPRDPVGTATVPGRLLNLTLTLQPVA